MASSLAPGTPVFVLCPHHGTRLRRAVLEHATAGLEAGCVKLRKPDGTVEQRSFDTLTVDTAHEGFLSGHLEFYMRAEGRVLERRPLAGLAGQLTSVRAEVARVFRVPEGRIGVRLAA